MIYGPKQRISKQLGGRAVGTVEEGGRTEERREMRMGMRERERRRRKARTKEERGRARKRRRSRRENEGERERPRKREVARRGKRGGEGVTPEGMQRGSGCASSLFVSGLTIKLLA